MTYFRCSVKTTRDCASAQCVICDVLALSAVDLYVKKKMSARNSYRAKFQRMHLLQNLSFPVRVEVSALCENPACSSSISVPPWRRDG
jgi:hypothetical protein